MSPFHGKSTKPGVRQILAQSRIFLAGLQLRLAGVKTTPGEKMQLAGSQDQAMAAGCTLNRSRESEIEIRAPG